MERIVGSSRASLRGLCKRPKRRSTGPRMATNVTHIVYSLMSNCLLAPHFRAYLKPRRMRLYVAAVGAVIADDLARWARSDCLKMLE